MGAGTLPAAALAVGAGGHATCTGMGGAVTQVAAALPGAAGAATCVGTMGAGTLLAAALAVGAGGHATCTGMGGAVTRVAAALAVGAAGAWELAVLPREFLPYLPRKLRLQPAPHLSWELQGLEPVWEHLLPELLQPARVLRLPWELRGRQPVWELAVVLPREFLPHLLWELHLQPARGKWLPLGGPAAGPATCVGACTRVPAAALTKGAAGHATCVCEGTGTVALEKAAGPATCTGGAGATTSQTVSVL